MLQKKLKTDKNKCCGLGHAVWECPYPWPEGVLSMGVQEYDGEVGSIEQSPGEKMDTYSKSVNMPWSQSG